MNLKDQVCSLELAKKLKVLRIKQESLFWWSKKTGEAKVYLSYGSPCGTWQIKPRKWMDRKTYSAFTVAELGEMLPEYIVEDSFNYHLNTWELNKIWRIGYCKYEAQTIAYVEDKSEANARAKMLIYLLENKLLKGA